MRVDVPEFVVTEAQRGGWRWELRDENGVLRSAGREFGRSRRECEREVEWIRQNACRAVVLTEPLLKEID